MKLNKKKGFTIVELVIVIAVIAILAAVLIPNISKLVKKANASADESLVRNLNTALAMDTEKHTTMSAALKAAYENGGYDVAKIVTKNDDAKILWDSVNDCFVYLNGGDPVYLPNTQTKKNVENWDFFEIVNTKPSNYADATYSIYANWTAAADETVADLKVGFDAGSNQFASISFSASDNRSVILNTNGSALTVNADQATVNHYGEATVVTITAVASESYHEFGTIGFLQITKGRVVVESQATVITVYAASSNGKIENNSGTIENAYAASGVVNTGNVVLGTLPEGKTVDDVKQEAVNKQGAVAVVAGEYQVSLEAAFTKALSAEVAVIDIIRDIDMSNISWKPIDIGSHDKGAINTVCKDLTINGNNHIITGFNVHVTSTNDPKGEIGAGASNYYGAGLFGRIGSGVTVNVNDLTFEKAVVDDSRMKVTASAHTSQVAVVVGISSGNTTLKNVNIVDSYVCGGEKVGAMIGHSNSINNKIVGGSIINTKVECKVAFVAQAVGYFGKSGISISNLELKDNVVSVDNNSVGSWGKEEKYYFDELNNEYIYGSEYWYLLNATVAFYGKVTETNKTFDQKTAVVYGEDAEYTKSGNLYSVVIQAIN